MMSFLRLNMIRSPVTAFLEYLRERTSGQDAEGLIAESCIVRVDTIEDSVGTSSSSNGEEVAIRIVCAGEQESARQGQNQVSSLQMADVLTSNNLRPDVAAADSDGESSEGIRIPQTANVDVEREGGNRVRGLNNIDTSYQRHYIHQATRWIEQVLPFSLLLLLIFIRQHLQGFFIIIWISAVMFKSNDIIRKQTSLKGEKKTIVLFCYSLIFVVHVVAVHWWYWNDNLIHPMIMVPPKAIPPFWHAVFIIMVNDILVRQAAMVLKCILLIYYRNSKARNFRRQGQMLTVVEYWLLLYRALLPAPVWYRFFLNKEYGGLFSSLMTGLYLTFKLTSIVEKVQFFIASIKALSQKEVHYGAYATSDQVTAAGDMCVICQEKMRSPISLCCKHLFCEDCVSEWFEGERTCPLCRALVKPTDLTSFADGSTSLLFQLF